MKTAQKEILTTDLRNTLKSMFQKELEKLPETLELLEPKERFNILCKLMTYVFPKVEAVTHLQGEPDEFKIQRWHD